MFYSHTSTIGGNFPILSETSIFLMLASVQHSLQGAKCDYFFLAICDVLLLRGDEVSFDIWDGECVG